MTVRFGLRISALVATLLAVTACTSQAEQTSTNVRIVKNNPGGPMIGYAMTSLRFREQGYMVRFNGFCDSACTLLLGLPAEQLCLNPGASFGFHLPYGSTRKVNKAAEEYLYAQYPDWVRDWISDQGGLRSRVKRMYFGTANAHIKRCNALDDDAPASNKHWIQSVSIR